MSGYVINSLDEVEELIEGYLETIENSDFSVIGEYDSLNVRMKIQMDFAQLTFRLYKIIKGENVIYIFAKLLQILNNEISDQESINALDNEVYFESSPYTFGTVYGKFLKMPNNENKLLLNATLKMYELLCGLMNIDNADEKTTNFIEKYIGILSNGVESAIAETELVDSEDDEKESRLL